MIKAPRPLILERSRSKLLPESRTSPILKKKKKDRLIHNIRGRGIMLHLTPELNGSLQVSRPHKESEEAFYEFMREIPLI